MNNICDFKLKCSNTYTLWCLVQDGDTPFCVDISSALFISDLKEENFKHMTSRGFNASYIILTKVCYVVISK